MLSAGVAAIDIAICQCCIEFASLVQLVEAAKRVVRLTRSGTAKQQAAKQASLKKKRAAADSRDSLTGLSVGLEFSDDGPQCRPTQHSVLLPVYAGLCQNLLTS
ncbi:unnamed protein product [Toxocara canis]|uniref:Uncharacterized protein n=1 Tax=Toxocara canis TaxID=6265 RepID=A0A183VFC8_TOXCA|nr:unnamed protein product [Toxocara canis]